MVQNRFFKIFIFIIFLLNFYPASALAGDFILDPGHSPNSPGATSCTGLSEVKYNDELATTVANFLKSKNMDIEVTRKPDQNMSLNERVKNTQGKNLFISLHHDSVQSKYIKKINDLPTTDRDKGFSIFVSRKNKNFEESLKYAKVLGSQLLKAGLKPSSYHSENIPGENKEILDAERGIFVYDDLIVLKNSKCPALLLEGGVIVNPEDEKMVKTDDFKNKVAKAIYHTLKSSRKKNG